MLLPITDLRKVSTRSILHQPMWAPKWCKCLFECGLRHACCTKRQLHTLASTLMWPSPGAPTRVQPYWEQPRQRQGPFSPRAPLCQPRLLVRPPHWELLRFRWKYHAAGEVVMQISSAVFKISFWDCLLLGLGECYQIMVFFWASAEQSFCFFPHISHTRTSQEWLQGAPH